MHPEGKTYWGFIKLQLHGVHHFERYRFLITVFILTVFFLLGIYLVRSYFNPSPRVLGLKSDSPNGQLVPTVLPPPIPVRIAATPAVPFLTIYDLTVSLKPEAATVSGFMLADLLAEAFNLPLVIGQPYPITALNIEASPSAGRFYIVFPASSVLKESYYESKWLQVRVKPADQKLQPYLLNNTFCQVDTDCLIRQSYCTVGAFNRFDPYLENVTCLQTSPIPTCPAQETAVSPRCVANRCLTQVKYTCL